MTQLLQPDIDRQYSHIQVSGVHQLFDCRRTTQNSLSTVGLHALSFFHKSQEKKKKKKEESRKQTIVMKASKDEALQRNPLPHVGLDEKRLSIPATPNFQ